MKIDLHMHSVESDGGATIEEILEDIMNKKIEVISITDHNVLYNLDWFRTKMFKQISGVEISTEYNSEEIHILAYGVTDKIKPFLESIRSNICKEHIRIVSELSKKFNQLSVVDYHNYEFDAKKGGWKLLDYLYSRKVIHEPCDYDVLVGTIISNHIYPNPQIVIDEIHKSQGLGFLAHPCSYGFDINDAISDFVSFGIDGLECYHPSLDKEKSDLLIELAFKYNLKISGGSDFHKYYMNRSIGNPEIYINNNKMRWIYDIQT